MLDIYQINWQTHVAFLVGFSVFCASYLIWFYHNRFQYFVKLGIKGPKPVFVLGNLREMFGNQFETSNFQLNWLEKYGKFYGVFFGHSPVIFVSDVEVIRQICIKDFDVFPNHSVHDLMIDFQKKWLIFLQDDEWRRVRALMTPTFTSGKIKRMFPILDTCSDDLVAIWREQLGKNKADDGCSAIINVKESHCVYTVDAITTCCFGLKLKRAQGVKSLEDAASKDEIAKILLRFFARRPYRFIISKVFPLSLLTLIGFKTTPTKQYVDSAAIAKRVIDARRASGKKIDDYLQLLIDARLEDKLEMDQMDGSENHHAGLTQESLEEDQRKLIEQVIKSQANSKATLSDFEILSETMLLLVVGMETTANMLTKCIYALAFHREIQEKLYQTVKLIAKYDANKKLYFEYDDVTNCLYLDSVISETLRCLPVVTMIDRVANRDYHVKKYNFLIPKDMQLFISYYSILNDPDYWHEPKKFNPERFMPENRDKLVPGAYIPFGTGPRHCIGMRFSLTESKLAIAKAVMNFKFSPVDGLKFPPKNGGVTGIISSIKDPRVKVTARN